MNATTETIALAILLPGAVAAFIVYFVRRLEDRLPLLRVAQPATRSLAIAVAISAAWALLRLQTTPKPYPPLIPAQPWHAIPAVAWLAVLLSPPLPRWRRVFPTNGIASDEIATGRDESPRQPVLRISPAAIIRYLLYGLAAGATALLLVPNWKSLQPPRTTWLPALFVYLLLLHAAASRALGRPSTALIATGQMLIATAATILGIGLMVSITYVRFALPAAAAWAGIWLMMLRRPDLRAAAPSFSLSYAVVIGGWAFVGCIEPRTPALLLLALPWSGCVLALFAWGQARLRHSNCTFVVVAMVLQLVIIGAVYIDFYRAMRHE